MLQATHSIAPRRQMLDVANDQEARIQLPGPVPSSNDEGAAVDAADFEAFLSARLGVSRGEARATVVGWLLEYEPSDPRPLCFLLGNTVVEVPPRGPLEPGTSDRGADE